MTPKEYNSLQGQIDRQTVERQEYLDAATVASGESDALQPAIDAALAAGDQSLVDSLRAQQAAFTSQANAATQQAAALEAAIQSCQALIDAEPPPTPAQQAAARAEWLAYLLFLRREAVANAVQQVPVLVADLPIALEHAGLRAFVLDATKDKFGDVVGGGGPNKVPVYSDGLVWRIG